MPSRSAPGARSGVSVGITHVYFTLDAKKAASLTQKVFYYLYLPFYSLVFGFEFVLNSFALVSDFFKTLLSVGNLNTQILGGLLGGLIRDSIFVAYLNYVSPSSVAGLIDSLRTEEPEL